VEQDGQVWLRAPQAPGPAPDDPLGAAPTGAAPAHDDPIAVLHVAIRVLLDLHACGLTHRGLDGGSMLLDPDGAPLVVMAEPGTSHRDRDAVDVAGLAWVLAGTWCAGDPGAAALLRDGADLAESAGPAARWTSCRRWRAPDAGPPVVARAWTARLRPCAGGPVGDRGPQPAQQGAAGSRAPGTRERLRTE
jgi:hypothetical protein